LIIKHIKRIGLSYSKIAIIFLFVSCGNDTNKLEDTNRIEDANRIKEINTLRAKGTKCNNIIYPKEHNLTKVDNCLESVYAYTSSIQVETIDILKSLDNDSDCIYILGHYVQYINLEDDLINTCGNTPSNQ